MTSESLVVTSPTGVDVTLVIAGPGSRAYAFLIDWHIRLLLAITWYAAAAISQARFGFAMSRAAATTWVSLPPVLIYFLYHPVVELAMRGRTPGKRMAGVRIVNRQGGTPSSLAVLVRNAFRLLDCLPILYGVGLCTTILSAQRLRCGDMAAGTLLVHDGDTESQALSRLGSLTLNPALDAATATLGNDLLLRWKELAPATRQRLARDLLARIAATDAAAAADREQPDAQLQQRVRDALAGRVR